MKTYEEMARNALERIGAYEAQKEKRKKTIRKLTGPAVSLCLIAVFGFAAWKGGLFGRLNSLTPATGSGDAPVPGGAAPAYSGEELPGDPETGVPAVTEAAAPAQPDVTVVLPPVPAAPDATTQPVVAPADTEPASASALDNVTVADSCLCRWNNRRTVTGDLLLALQGDPNGSFDVTAVYRPAGGEITTFLYEGKTLADWAAAMSDEWVLRDKMETLLKVGDDLKYGDALYTTGTPTGEKWDPRHYEAQVANYGEELLSRYIVGGEFLREELERDLAVYRDNVNTSPARQQYELALQAYMDTVVPAAARQLTALGISCEQTAGNALSCRLTAAQLDTLPLEDEGCWVFTLTGADPSAPSDAVAPASDAALVVTG